MNRTLDLGNAKNVHFIGIGGISMSGLAEITLRHGYRVSGSDNSDTAVAHLRQAGIEVMIPNAADNIKDDHDLVVYTAAIKPDNPEYMRAQALGIPMMERPLLLKAITRAYERTLCVAGSHGKTTTSALLASVVLEAGLDPTVHIGGRSIGDINNRIGDSSYFVLEACEYRNSFLHWHPFVGTILNVDADHNDFYNGMDGLIDSFVRFARTIHPDGALVIHSEAQGLDKVIAGLDCRVIEYGMDKIQRRSGGMFFSPANIFYDTGGRASFDVMKDAEKLTRVDMPLVGAHNILNALACFGVAEVLGIPAEATKRGLEKSQGMKRRYEAKGNFNDVPIIDDYAHHPTEVRACLAAARKSHSGRIICVFQPHLYSRTRDLLEDFANSFTDADKILLLPIYAAREAHDPNISSRMLGERMSELSKDVECFENFNTIEHWLRKNLTDGDLLITMGAGNVHLAGECLL
ncbi:MAG: UDP-N-acetylmuramate--L-alanine ligase [Defluviitaleaceae bacterium]|nr:UDP-N-acetylmuramate--L-alanine ligase [Defluviitaleaceae bacterium]